MKKTLKGYYRHFKGGIVLVVDEGIHTETSEIYIVYYHKNHGTGKMTLWLRPKKMFLETVKHNGKKVPRFEYIGDQIEEIEDYITSEG